MTEDNDAPPETSRRFDLATLSIPLDLETEQAGILRIGPLDAGVLIAVAPQLESASNIPESSLAKSMMLKMARNLPTLEGAECAPLTKEQEGQITEEDVRNFSNAVLKREQVKDIIGESGEPLPPELALVRYVREWSEKISEPMKRWNTALGADWLSASTRNAFGNFKLQRAISESMRPPAWISDLAIGKRLAAEAERIARATEYPGGAAFRSPQADTATGRLAAELGKLETSLPQLVTRPNFGAKELCDTIRNNNPSSVLGAKLDELKEAIGNGTDLTEKLLSESVAATREHLEQAKAQGQTDAHAQQRAIWWAVGGIAVSACLGLASLVVSYQSLSHDFEVEASAAKERIASAPKEEERFQILREQLTAQQEQNRLLRELLAQSVQKAKIPQRPK